ncbi:DUF2817 domain-containing protein [Deefgea chitinilytica]|uniref:DUF2817 domain-containing protein n=2 Tax=Chitinibacteraceae TaxID=2897177 RepID=A0ABS2C9D8_9NEIS|nr:DUF2817 domain-containing protein [Deefgea chitinilytica]MBM9888005.1 DUF2817 domain-containing protein [Deefgea sp. CFH1-16]
MVALQKIIAHAGALIRCQHHGNVTHQGQHFPLYSLCLGSQAASAPTIGFFAGVHGLERIGSQILLAFLQSLLFRLSWDRTLQYQLQTIRIVFMPIINPVGMALRRRSNGNRIDLMRNAPIDADGKTAFLVGGHRINPVLPWFRGQLNAEMELENQALCTVVQDFMLCSSISLALDCHSGFGLRDRIWFPYAYTLQPIPQLAELHALKQLFDHSHPHHPYVIEPQAKHYRTHGDVWDYLHRQQTSQQLFLPLTLELGSWLWIKKNPRQLLSILGLFHPMVPHRQQRVLRSHLPLLEFLIRATHDHARWRPTRPIQKMEQHHAAIELWYRKDRP